MRLIILLITASLILSCGNDDNTSSKDDKINIVSDRETTPTVDNDEKEQQKPDIDNSVKNLPDEYDRDSFPDITEKDEALVPDENSPDSDTVQTETAEHDTADETIPDEDSVQIEYEEVAKNGISFKWRVVNKQLDIILSAPTTGWIAVGFEPSIFMKDANILIGYVDENGNSVVEDQFGDSGFTHKPDVELGGSSDITVSGGSEGDNKTELIFSIPLDSGDSFDKVLTAGSKYKIILSYGGTDDLSKIHVAKTSEEIVL